MAKFIADSATLTLEGTQIENMCASDISINISCETASMRCFGDGGWIENLPHSKTWDVTFETALDSSLGVDLDNTKGKEGDLVISLGDGKPVYTCPIVITKCDITSPVDDISKVSWSAVGSGEIYEGNVS